MRGWCLALSLIFPAAADDWVQPFPKGTCTQTRPHVGAYFSPEISPLGLTLTLDGQNCTEQASKDFGFWSFRPAGDLSRGRHHAVLQGRTLAGQPFSRTWSFTVGEIASLQISHSTATAGQLNVTFSAPVERVRVWLDGREVAARLQATSLALTYPPGAHRLALLALGQDGSVLEKSWTVGP